MQSLNTFNYLCAISYGFLLLATNGGGGRESIFDFEMREIWRDAEGFFTMSEMMMDLTSTIVRFFTGVFVIAQMLPSYRSLVGDITKQMFCLAIVGQLCWIASMVNEVPILGFICSLIVAGAFGFILFSQKKHMTEETPEGYWLIQFPLSLAAGWAFVTLMMTLNIMIVGGDGDNDGGDEDDDGGFSISIGKGFWTALSFLTMVVVAVVALMRSPIAPDYGVPAILGWSIIGFAIGGEDRRDDNGGDDEDGGFSLPVSTIITVVAFLTGLGIIFGTIFAAHKDVKESKEGTDEYKKESFLVEKEGATA